MGIVDFLRVANKLKDVKRTGWVKRGVKGPESVADHSFMMALMCMVMPTEGIDMGKAIKMALVHDIAEAETGDIITTESWKDGGTMARAEKLKLEEEALKGLAKNLDEKTGNEIIMLWKEYAGNRTPEAVFVNDIDMAEMIIQAHGYHSKGNYKQPLHGFWDERNMGKIRNESIKKLVMNIIGKGR